MTIYLLERALAFPDPAKTDDPSGILAVGGDLSPGRLVLAYSLGIFPWYDEKLSPILWHCPEQRFVLRPDELHMGRSLRRAIREIDVTVTYDDAFDDVVRACAEVPRFGQDGTWLNEDMQAAYMELHRQDYAHSAEAWVDGRLVGGLYGVTLGGVFFGESMFSLVPAASKAIFAALVPKLAQAGYRLIDCQIYTEHLARFGAQEWSRLQYLAALKKDLMVRPRPKWPRSIDSESTPAPTQ